MKAWLNKWKGLVVLAVLLLVLSLVWELKLRPATTHKNAAIEVEAATVTSGTVSESIKAMGSLSVADTVILSAPIAGKIQAVLFKPGQFVHQGDVLVQMDSSSNTNSLAQAQIALKLSEQNFKPMADLLAHGAVTQQAYEQARLDLEAKKAALKLTEDITSLRAPMDGVMGDIVVNAGNVVAQGAKITDMVRLKNLKVDFAVPQQYLPELKVGQVVSIKVDAYPDTKFSGRVSFISSNVDPLTRTIAEQALLDNANDALHPGMAVRVKQTLDQTEPALLFPQKSLMPTISNQQVYKIVQKGNDLQVMPVVVDVLQRKNTDVAVKVDACSSTENCLKVGDRVVTAGQQKLKDGSFVLVR